MWSLRVQLQSMLASSLAKSGHSRVVRLLIVQFFKNTPFSESRNCILLYYTVLSGSHFDYPNNMLQQNNKFVQY